MNKSKIFFTGLFALYASVSDAQSITPSTINSGGNYTVAGGNIYEYSIGEMTSVSTVSSSSIIVTQGLLQPAANGAGISKQTIPDNQLNVYPVPASSVLYIQPEFNGKGKLSYVLLDAAGKQVYRSAAQLNSGRELQQLDLSAVVPGNYLLDLVFESGEKTSGKIFKIQKTQ